MKTPMKHVGILLISVSSLLLSCVSIKPSTVALSDEVGKRIVDMQSSHQMLMSSYFDQEKKKVDDFITETWTPKFLANFIKTSDIMNILKTDPKPETVIMDFAKAAHVEMQKQRNLMLAPIDNAKLQAVTTLNDAYAELLRGHSTVTARLEAATKRSTQQDELLDKLKLKEISQKATDSMVHISTKVQNALEKARSSDLNVLVKTITDTLK